MRTVRRVSLGVAPGDHLVRHEPDRLAAAEASLRIVASGLRDRPRAQVRKRFVQCPRVLLDRPVELQRDRGGKARLLAGGGRHEHLLVRQLGRVLGRHDHVALFGSTTTSSA